MADSPEPVTEAPGKHQLGWDRARPILKWIGIAILALAALVAAALFMLQSGPGRRFIASEISKMNFANGMQVGVDRIDGNIYGAMTIHGVTLSDPSGVFFRAPLVRLDWRPFKYLRNHVDIHSLVAPTADLLRTPQFKATPPSKGPLLPNLDITVGRLLVDRLVVEPAVTGERRVGSILGQAQIADGKAQLRLKTGTIAGTGRAGGDRLQLALDAVPQQNRLAIQLAVDAPANGVLARLAGLSQGLELRVHGHGDWQRWSGQLAANLGDAPFARLALNARNGTFSLVGPMRPSRLLQGTSAALLGQTTNVSVVSTWDHRVADFKAALSSDAFMLRSTGTADLGRSRLRNVHVGFALLRPAVIMPKLSGLGVRADAQLNGSLSRPNVQYHLQAASIAFGNTGATALDVTGVAHWAKDHWGVGVDGRAAAITGVDAAAGGTIQNVRLSGDLAIDWPRILSDNLHIRSNRIDATAIILANVSTGLYSGALKGTVDHYRISSVGIFNLQSDAKLKSTGNGLVLTGRLRAKSTTLFNDSVRKYLGGNFVASTDLAYGPDGIFHFSGLRLSAPLLRVTSGNGSYAPGGRIKLEANAVSKQYGPLGIQVTGTVAHPNATVAASRPGLGLGLTNLKAQVTSSGNGYALHATANTSYGPLSADVVLGTGRGPMSIDIRHASLAGINMTGRVRQSPAGPFVGQLQVSGRGLNGTVQLAAVRQNQQLVAHLRGHETVLPPPANISARFVSVDANVILSNRPQIEADVQLAGAHYATTEISKLRAIVNYWDGRGSAQMVAEGRSGVPFRVALNSNLQPNLWRVALKGEANGVNFHTVTPARIVPGNGTYQLLPTQIALDQGRIDLSGRYGAQLKVNARLENVSTGLFDTFAPGLGISGSASGNVDFATLPSSFPTADAQLAIRGLTRTTAQAVSEPMDVNLVASLQPSSASIKAVMRTRGTVIGRLQAFAQPLGPGRGWTERIMAAPVRGGIRFMGPADSLFSLAGLSDQTLKGALGVAADFSCRVGNPCLSGVVRGRNLTYRNETYGTKLTDMTLNGQFSGERLQVQTLTATAGSGTVSGSGSISLSASKGFPTDISLRMDHAKLARGDDLDVTASGNLKLVKTANSPPLVSGTVQLPSTRYKFVREGSAEVPKLSGVHFKSAAGQAQITGEASETPTDAFGNVGLNLKIVAQNQLFVSGMGLDSEWSANLHVTGTSANPSIAGSVNLVRGNLSFAGRSFKLAEGRIRFNGGDASHATISLSGTETINDVDVRLNVGGSVNDPQISFTSTPGLPQDEIMSRILFGNSIGSLSTMQAVQLAASLNALRGPGGGGLNPFGKLRSAAGVDQLKILGADKTSGRGTALEVGKYITNDIYIDVVTDARGFTATQLEITLSPSLSLLSQAGGASGTNVSVRYRKRY